MAARSLMTDAQKHIIGLVFYPGMTALDIVGPQQVFSALPDIQIHRIWKTLDPIQTDDGMMLVPNTTFENCPPLDVICIGGGLGQMAVVDNPEALEFFQRQVSTAKFSTSGSGGPEFLAKAGLLPGYRAATDWMAREQLANLGIRLESNELSLTEIVLRAEA
jgi:cyclohexyl-isocyanide hydratase